MNRHIRIIILLFLCGNLLMGCSPLESGSDILPVRASGILEAQTYHLALEVSGEVAEVLVDRGETVAPGQPLLRLDDSLLERAREQAEAGVAGAKGALTGLEKGPSAGQLAAVRAALAGAEADLRGAQAGLDLLKAVYSPLDPPVEDLRQSEFAVSLAQAGVDLARAKLDQVLAGTPEKELALARGLLAEAEASLRLVDARLALQTLISPVDGQVRLILVQLGEVAVAGSPLVQIIDPSQLILRLYIPEALLGSLAPGDMVQLTVDAYPGEVFQGTVRRIADQAQFTPSGVQTSEERVKLVFAVDVDLDNRAGRLKPGMPADAVIFPFQGK